MRSAIEIRDCLDSKDLIAIEAILNHAITTSTALYDYEPWSMDVLERWLENKRKQRLPVRGAYDSQGNLLGFGTYGPFRTQPAYKYTVEHSLYVNQAFMHQGIGTLLLTDLIEQASAGQYHVLVACIDLNNQASIALHQKLGFTHCGTVKQAGFKFGCWLDTAFYQRTLHTPDHPVDGR